MNDIYFQECIIFNEYYTSKDRIEKCKVKNENNGELIK